MDREWKQQLTLFQNADAAEGESLLNSIDVREMLEQRGPLKAPQQKNKSLALCKNRGWKRRRSQIHEIYVHAIHITLIWN